MEIKIIILIIMSTVGIVGWVSIAVGQYKAGKAWDREMKRYNNPKFKIKIK
jgi:hypothetical protein